MVPAQHKPSIAVFLQVVGMKTELFVGLYKRLVANMLYCLSQDGIAEFVQQLETQGTGVVLEGDIVWDVLVMEVPVFRLSFRILCISLATSCSPDFSRICLACSNDVSLRYPAPRPGGKGFFEGIDVLPRVWA
jgi:hypothetical protein